MANLIVNGGKPLSGTITPAGNKNSVLPILCATLLTDDEVTLRNVPDLTDVNKLVELLEQIGSKVLWDKKTFVLKINNSQIAREKLAEELPIGMRGSVLMFAPLLNRIKHVHLKAEIGGCALGIRELDPHLEVLEALGTKIMTNDEDITMDIEGRFKGCKIWQDYMSVTTTENFIMGASVANGESEMNNAASEPHVQDLCNFLIS
ncbi:MAG TPA: UDP-N-acetylglucosamine 1-carboxyvinyltransferase, partial [Candidatus Dojkabacteria bacterium]|nr:UDP-N-acetylglucosamine 1-carboxyvinyltransferase [Candidatus Dojkabacteria bacterium]